MKITNIDTIHRGFLKTQAVTVENTAGDSKMFERTIHSPVVVGICHDPINDKVMLVEQYRYGAMMPMLEFPAGIIDKGENADKAVAREILEETGVVVKSTTLLQTCMAMPGSMYAPMNIFYVTFDSRQVTDGDVLETGGFEVTTVVLRSAKELIRDVESNMIDSLPVIVGAQYLKLLHRGLAK